MRIRSAYYENTIILAKKEDYLSSFVSVDLDTWISENSVNSKIIGANCTTSMVEIHFCSKEDLHKFGNQLKGIKLHIVYENVYKESFETDLNLWDEWKKYIKIMNSKNSKKGDDDLPINK